MNLPQADNPQQRLDTQFDDRLAAYRAAVGEPEAGRNFMPELWARIEARRTANARYLLWFRRWTTGLVAASAAACVFLGLVLATSTGNVKEEASYVDALVDDHATTAMPYLEASYRHPVNHVAPADVEGFE
jgi:hypothetical protein